MSDLFKPLLGRLADGATLSEADAEVFFTACLRGEVTPAQIGAAVTAMRIRGETVGEITACARAMRRQAVALEHAFDVVDTCGTGGDGLHTLNISTAAALVTAAAGVKVAKHGNRAVSSRSGTSDVISALGVKLDPGLPLQRTALEEAGICFLFAPAHHAAMRHVMPARTELGFRTIFNLLGPLVNPASPRRQVVGVPTSRFVEPIARALGALGSERAWVVHGQGMDELTTTGGTEVAEWHDGLLRHFTVTPEAVGLPRASLAALQGGAPEENAAALRVADAVETLREGVDLGGRRIIKKRARATLERLVAITNAEA